MKIYLLITTILITSTNLLSQTTFVPDDNFEQALIDQGFDSGALDDHVPTANINGISILDIGGENISNLTGIEDFTALTELFCWVNAISTLDLSGNPNLVRIEARENQLTSVNISSNPNLVTLSLGDNLLSNVDVSSNFNLEALSVFGNSGINSIDVSANTSLRELNVNRTSISALNVTSNIDLTILGISETPLTEIDLSENINLEIIESIEVSGITNLDLSASTSLRRLWHADGNLSNLILPEIDSIEWLILSNNNLTSVDFLPETNSALELLYLNFNQIAEMDLSSKGFIFWLRANNNDGLTFLDIRDTEVTIMYADGNPDLQCLFVDDANWASSYPEYAIDSTTTFVETEAECNALSIEDELLEASIVIYPNPTKGVFNIHSRLGVTFIKIRVTNSLGQLLFERQNSNTVDISTYSKGIYFVTVESQNGGAANFKIVRE